MTLKELITNIGNMAIQQKLVNYFAAGSSLYSLNPENINFYPALFLSPTGNHQAYDNTTRYSITLYYIDRLLQDNSNDIDIYSSAIENLKNLVLGIASIDGVVETDRNYIIRNFNQEQMNDRLAGAYATIEIVTLNETECFEYDEIIDANEEP